MRSTPRSPNDRDDDHAGPDACVVLPSGSESQARHDPTAKRSGNKTQNDAYTNVTELIGQPHAWRTDCRIYGQAELIFPDRQYKNLGPP